MNIILIIPSNRDVIGSIKDVRISVVPGPPEELDSQDVKGNIKKAVKQSNSKRLTPPW